MWLVGGCQGWAWWRMLKVPESQATVHVAFKEVQQGGMMRSMMPSCVGIKRAAPVPQHFGSSLGRGNKLNRVAIYVILYSSAI